MMVESLCNWVFYLEAILHTYAIANAEILVLKIGIQYCTELGK